MTLVLIGFGLGVGFSILVGYFIQARAVADDATRERRISDQHLETAARLLRQEYEGTDDPDAMSAIYAIEHRLGKTVDPVKPAKGSGR